MSPDKDTDVGAPPRHVQPSVVHRLTGSWGTRDEVRREVQRSLPDDAPDVNEKLVDALIAQGNKSAHRMSMLAGGVLLLAVVIVSMVLGAPFAFKGLGIELGSSGTPAEAAP